MLTAAQAAEMVAAIEDIQRRTPDGSHLPPLHENCDAPWYCERCELPVCPRCEVSPGEFELCRDCWELQPEGAA
jgi:hypothetical protein